MIENFSGGVCVQFKFYSKIPWLPNLGILSWLVIWMIWGEYAKDGDKTHWLTCSLHIQHRSNCCFPKMTIQCRTVEWLNNVGSFYWRLWAVRTCNSRLGELIFASNVSGTSWGFQRSSRNFRFSKVSNSQGIWKCWSLAFCPYMVPFFYFPFIISSVDTIFWVKFWLYLWCELKWRGFFFMQFQSIGFARVSIQTTFGREVTACYSWSKWRIWIWLRFCFGLGVWGRQILFLHSRLEAIFFSGYKVISYLRSGTGGCQNFKFILC